ncbi:MAG: hypothetical protein ABFC56_12715 [Clostridiaceae bacterium]
MSISNAALRNTTDDYSCEELAPIFSDRELYIFLERFCNQVAATQPEYQSFLQHFFNDEGYVDIWRIPHVMMDVLLHRTRFNRVFDNREFRKTFHRFIRELMVFCSRECHRNTLSAPVNGTIGTRSQSSGHDYLNALMTSFSRVLEILASEEH